MSIIKSKLGSRKLWMAVMGVIVGLAVAFGGDPEEIETIIGSIISAASTVSYIFAEAFTDVNGETQKQSINLEDMTRAELIAFAIQNNINGVTTEMTKTELLAAIQGG